MVIFEINKTLNEFFYNLIILFTKHKAEFRYCKSNDQFRKLQFPKHNCSLEESVRLFRFLLIRNPKLL